jgi:hypothetical protein
MELLLDKGNELYRSELFSHKKGARGPRSDVRFWSITAGGPPAPTEADQIIQQGVQGGVHEGRLSGPHPAQPASGPAVAASLLVRSAAIRSSWPAKTRDRTFVCFRGVS